MHSDAFREINSSLIPPQDFLQEQSWMKAQISYPFKEINIGKLLHLIHISMRPNDLFVVEKDPGFASALSGGDLFAYKCHVMSVNQW